VWKVSTPKVSTMSDIYEGILKLRSLRDYEDRQINEVDLERILEAARWTGSAKNRQNWAFVVIQEADQQQRIAACGDFTTPIRNAPTTVALVEEPEGYEFDTGRLAQNIMLAADAIGVASCPVTLHRDADAAIVLGLPEGYRCRYAVTLGYAKPSAVPARFGGRKSINELVHRDRY